MQKLISLTTMSCILDINSKIRSIDLLLLATYLELNESIVGLYLNYLRGVVIIKKGDIICRETGFYNQLALNIVLKNGKSKKVKIFSKGKVHICGCKSYQEIEEIYYIIEKYLKNFKMELDVEYYPVGNLIIDKNNFIYNTKDNSVFGLISNKDVYFHGYIVKPYKNSYWCAVKGNIKNISNNNGEHIGYIDQKTNEFISEQHEHVVLAEDGLEDLYEKLNINIGDDMKLNDIKIILCNAKLKLGKNINKDVLSASLKKEGYHIFYEPVIYHALKLYHYFGETSEKGKCKCKELCYCNKGTVLISSNGTILLYGFRSQEEHRECIENISHFL
jgi:TATA-box binding protein (TBP) (component of TFIID and TFIIIB)